MGKQKQVCKTGRRFPWWSLNPRNSATTELRWSIIAGFLLSSSRPPKFQYRSSTNRFALVSIVRKVDLAMSAMSLKSFNKIGKTAPKLILGCDDSLNSECAQEFYGAWPGGVDAYSVSDVAQWHRLNGDDLLARFCEAHVFGFKHCLCLMAMKRSQLPILYSDSDVLWFRDPATLLSKYCSRAFFGSVDCGMSYNFALLEKFREYKKLLSNGPGINAGFAIFNEPPFYSVQENEFIEALLKETPVHFFSEQTLFAILVKKYGGIISDGDVNISEKRSVLPSWIFQPWYARHYVSSVREQIWSDAIFL